MIKDPHGVAARRFSTAERMRADAQLPPDVRPAPARTGHAGANEKTALVTGATGFLGRYAVRSLLRDTTLDLVCLVRGVDAADAEDRLVASLACVAIPRRVIGERIRVLHGDVSLPRFGLVEARHEALVRDIDRVYHCAAHVNWARGYRQLRDTNVLGTLEVVRFACAHRAKPLLFVSTIAVCFAIGHEAAVDEDSDLLAHVDRMPLGYAQSKCVAEALLREAAGRGLPVTVLRPALISGDSVTGDANPDDLIAALIEGCARIGLSGDADWLLDCVPVDFVADVIAAVPLHHVGTSARTLHVVHDRPRRWLDIVACLNRLGCTIDAVPTGEWLRATFADRESAGARLYGYRRFFQGVMVDGRPLRPFETYLQRQQQRVNGERSVRALEALGLSAPPLDADLIARYLAHYRDAGRIEMPAA